MPLHEALTQRLFDELAKSAKETVIQPIDNPVAVFGNWLVLELAKNILQAEFLVEGGFTKEGLDVLENLHSLVSGDFDADRLDYIQRDLILSGIRDSGIRPDRLIELFKLAYNLEHRTEKEELRSIPRFSPDIRAVRSLEEFFSSRYDLYRSVIYHHHVVKTDGLLQEVVRKLALRWLSDDAGKGNNTSPTLSGTEEEELLTGNLSDIKWLWMIFEEMRKSGTEVRNTIYLQWDDHWLMSLLRREYIRLRTLDPNSEYVGVFCDHVLLKQLEDLIASKRNYVSIVKRLEDFYEVDLAFLTVFVTKFDKPAKEVFCFPTADTLSREQTDFEKGKREPFERFVTIIKRFQTHQNKGNSYGAVSAANDCLALLGPPLLPLHIAVRDGFLNAMPDLLDALFVGKKIKPGFDKHFMIHSAKGMQSFSDYSNLAKEFLDRQDKLPAFFLFVLPKNADVRIDRTGLINQLGELLATELWDMLNNCGYIRN